MVEPLELYDGTALDWIRDGDEVRVEVDEAVVRELEANPCPTGMSGPPRATLGMRR